MSISTSQAGLNTRYQQGASDAFSMLSNVASFRRESQNILVPRIVPQSWLGAAIQNLLCLLCASCPQARSGP